MTDALEELARLKAAYQQLATENQQQRMVMEAQQKRIQTMIAEGFEDRLFRNVRSGDTNMRYQAIFDYASKCVDKKLNWPSPSYPLIRLAWQKLKLDTAIPDEAITEKENDMLHPVILKVCTEITETLKTNMKFEMRANLCNPGLKPDIVGGTVKRFFGWPDVFFCGEIKLPNDEKHGTVQAMDYICWVVERSKSEELNDRVGIFTDFVSFAAMTFKKNKVQDGSLFCSPLLPLFPSNWRNLAEPTEGFKLLCHSLMVPIPAVLPVIPVNGTPLQISGTIFSSLENMVYLMEINNTRFAVKIAKKESRYARGLINSEHEKLKYLNAQSDIAPFLTALADYNIQNGFAMEFGTTLEVALLEELELWPEADVLARYIRSSTFLKPFFVTALEGIQKLHVHKWFHGDIRPSNLLIVNGTLRLIDFMTSGPYEQRQYLVRSGYDDPFCVSGVKGNSDYLYHWDLYGLAYSMIFMVLGDKDRDCFLNETARSNLVQLLAVKDVRGDLAAAGAKMILRLDEVATHMIPAEVYSDLKAVIAAV